MYAVEIDRSKRLLVISAFGQVSKEEVEAARQTVRDKLKGVGPGLRALTDLRWMTSMDPGAARHIAEIMDTLQQNGLVSVTRVLPDPQKDIGFNILSHFHYDKRIQIYTFENMAEALMSLAGVDGG